ncbi:MAG: hypothetical protein KKD94_03355, partial [Nanoarchaeota archaeon]|nr:hypothetical protein [Nanoarchaeota archaeon]MBU1988490.1 hypothetical protein [Nanoarchaeota archaeon]
VASVITVSVMGNAMFSPASKIISGVNANACSADEVCEMNDMNCAACDKPELIRFRVRYDVDSARNLTDIERFVNSQWVTQCEDKVAGSTCNMGEYALRIQDIGYIQGGESSIKVRMDSGNGHLVVGSNWIDLTMDEDDITTYNIEDMHLIIYPNE